MIDPTQLPVLLKILDFLFDESRKILQERREQRQAKQKEQMKSEEEVSEIQPHLGMDLGTSEIQNNTVSSDVISTRDELLHYPLVEQKWYQYEAELKHALKLMNIYAQNYRIAEEQLAKWGIALAPPIIIHNLAEAKTGFATARVSAQDILSKIYGKPVNVPLGTSHNEMLN